MTRSAAALIAVAAGLGASAAGADVPARWRPAPLAPPMPRHLAMRPALDAALPPATAAAAPATTPPVTPRPARRRRRPTAAPRPAPAPPRLTAQLAVGMAVDGANLSSISGGTTIGGTPYGTDTYQAARAYGFGEAFLGSRGLVVPGISAYLASQFRLTSSSALVAPVVDGWRKVEPLALRAAWTEADGVIDSGPLRTLRIRGGRQFVYGPAVAHLDGLALSWSTRWWKVGAYLGSRVPDWDTGDLTGGPRELVSGAEASLFVRTGPRAMTVRLRGLRFADVAHGDATLDWTPRPDVALTFTSRVVDRDVARHHLGVRIRVSDETRLAFEADLRRRADWLWDYELRSADPGQPRRYLDLGPRLPRTTVRARAGTVLVDNVDALLFGGLAVDGRTKDDPASLTSAGWVEGGGAFEVRVRRTFALTLSGLGRLYSRKDVAPTAVVIDREDQLQPLAWPAASVGERNLFEGGVQARFTGGARRFSASGELYARRTRYAELYRDDATTGPAVEALDPLSTVSVRGGGRFVFEAWVSPRLRLRTEYELSNRYFSAPEIAGLKSLRILAEGHY